MKIIFLNLIFFKNIQNITIFIKLEDQIPEKRPHENFGYGKENELFKKVWISEWVNFKYIYLTIN
jgi:hypothetical protein